MKVGFLTTSILFPNNFSGHGHRIGEPSTRETKSWEGRDEEEGNLQLFEKRGGIKPQPRRREPGQRTGSEDHHPQLGLVILK
jgi:hypothetical protein